jgi:hypothetical protein
MKTIRSVNLFDIFILLIVCVSYASIFLLVLNRFNPLFAILLGAVATAVLCILLRLKIKPHIAGIPYALMAVLFIALVFRFHPYLYVPGGQDQGTYVNMSAVYEKKGSTFIIDEVRQKAIASGLGEWYDSANQRGTSILKEKEYEGYHLPGIYIKDLANSEYVFQFYPLHPLWMAIAGKCAGKANRVYALVFFSLLSIVAIYLLAGELSGGSTVSSVAASVLLALNPLHAFFSKFPVTEIVALAFSSLAFFYLARYYNSTLDKKSTPFYLVLSSALFGCMFFTRISGFIYLPFFYFIAFLTILFGRERPLTKHLIFYVISIMFLYAASVTYGMIYSYPYAHDIYQIWFRRFFQSSWQIKLILVVIVATLSLLFQWLLRNQITTCCEGKVFLTFKQNLTKICCAALLLIIMIAFYKAYLLAFTDKYVGTKWDFAGIGARFPIAGLGFPSLNYSNIFVAIWYLSPLGFAVFIYSIFSIFPRKTCMAWTSFLAFLGLIWFSFTVFKFYTQFQYYYARYLSSEVIPYTLLGIGLALGHLFQKGRRWKMLSICLSAIIAVYFLYFTCYQFKGKSAEGAHSAFEAIAKVMDDDDLLLLYDLQNPHQVVVQTSLSYFYDVNVCNLRNPPVLSSKAGKVFLSKFKKVFLLSQAPLEIPFLRLVNEIEYKQGEFENSNFIPREFTFSEGKLYLYKAYNP